MKGEPERVVPSRIDKLFAMLRGEGVECAVLTSFASLRYFTGHTVSIETGPSPFAPVAGALVCARGEAPILFLANTESVEDVIDGLEIRTSSAYEWERPSQPLGELSKLVVGCFSGETISSVGVEMADLPAFILERLRSERPHLIFSDISSTLAMMRAIKDEEEIRAIRLAAELCDVGQAAVKKWSIAGLSELDVFAEMRNAMESVARARLPVLADLVSGVRTAAIGGNPTSSKLKEGDLLIADIVPRRNGYWADSCNTCAVGEPTSEQRRTFEGIESALRESIERIRPGVRACEIDSFLRQRVQALGGSYPHHSGHGIGVTFHEEPRITPYNQTTLQAGMVIALEPGIYFEGKWGMRLEHTVLVTQTGSEVLSKFQHAL